MRFVLALILALIFPLTGHAEGLLVFVKVSTTPVGGISGSGHVAAIGAIEVWFHAKPHVSGPETYNCRFLLTIEDDPGSEAGIEGRYEIFYSDTGEFGLRPLATNESVLQTDPDQIAQCHAFTHDANLDAVRLTDGKIRFNCDFNSTDVKTRALRDRDGWGCFAVSESNKDDSPADDPGQVEPSSGTCAASRGGSAWLGVLLALGLVIRRPQSLRARRRRPS